MRGILAPHYVYFEKTISEGFSVDILLHNRLIEGKDQFVIQR